MKSRLLERILVGLLLVVAGGVVVHAPLTVWLGTMWPAHELIIKSWKELLMGLALIILFVITVQQKKLDEFLSDRLIQLCLVYTGLHLVLISLFNPSANGGLQAAEAGLLIDLRFILYFVLVYGTIKLYPRYRRLFITVFLSGAVVVIGFAILQLLVLPKDILTHIGYSSTTIYPYLTVDGNSTFIRINSTLRGPNPLGAYAVIVVGLLTAAAVRWKLGRRGWWLASGAALATGLVLGASYSRSSVIGAIATIIVIIIISVTSKIRKQLLVSLGVVAIVVALVVTMFRDTHLVKNIVLHDNPSTGTVIDSNAGHAMSLIDGTNRVLQQPFGAGVGSTGSASLLGNEPLIIENNYLLVAHETGWLGLLLFGWLFVEVLRRLWERRKSALALGVFGSGIGLAIIGLLLPVWTDDTVSIVWWGLAAIAIAAPIDGKKVRKKHDTRTSN
ncbi:MAG: hypothetical protein WAW80_02140 [Candidatus Saccharimonadales bacterium]